MSNEGKIVSIDYVGSLDDGTVFDSSQQHGAPIEFECMAGQVIKGFDEAVVDMNVGDKKVIHLEPEEAYGEIREDLIQEVPLDQIPNGNDLPVGETIYIQGPDGQQFPTKVEKIKDGIVTFDMNHPMAGKPLNFAIELISVKDKD